MRSIATPQMIWLQSMLRQHPPKMPLAAGGRIGWLDGIYALHAHLFSLPAFWSLLPIGGPPRWFEAFSQPFDTRFVMTFAAYNACDDLSDTSDGQHFSKVATFPLLPSTEPFVSYITSSLTFVQALCQPPTFMISTAPPPPVPPCPQGRAILSLPRSTTALDSLRAIGRAAGLTAPSNEGTGGAIKTKRPDKGPPIAYPLPIGKRWRSDSVSSLSSLGRDDSASSATRVKKSASFSESATDVQRWDGIVRTRSLTAAASSQPRRGRRAKSSRLGRPGSPLANVDEMDRSTFSAAGKDLDEGWNGDFVFGSSSCPAGLDELVYFPAGTGRDNRFQKSHFSSSTLVDQPSSRSNIPLWVEPHPRSRSAYDSTVPPTGTPMSGPPPLWDRRQADRGRSNPRRPSPLTILPRSQPCPNIAGWSRSSSPASDRCSVSSTDRPRPSYTQAPHISFQSPRASPVLRSPTSVTSPRWSDLPPRSNSLPMADGLPGSPSSWTVRSMGGWAPETNGDVGVITRSNSGGKRSRRGSTQTLTGRFLPAEEDRECGNKEEGKGMESPKPSSSIWSLAAFLTGQTKDESEEDAVDDSDPDEEMDMTKWDDEEGHVETYRTLYDS